MPHASGGRRVTVMRAPLVAESERGHSGKCSTDTRVTRALTSARPPIGSCVCVQEKRKHTSTKMYTNAHGGLITTGQNLATSSPRQDNDLRRPHSGAAPSNEKDQATPSNTVKLKNVSERIQPARNLDSSDGKEVRGAGWGARRHRENRGDGRFIP